jgi:hypothetical protein
VIGCAASATGTGVAAASGITSARDHPPLVEAPPRPDVAPARPALVGKASWYGASHHGKRTASGEVFDVEVVVLDSTRPSILTGG